LIKEKLVGLSHAQKRSIQIVVDVLLMWASMWVAFYIRLAADGWLWPDGRAQWILFVLAPVLAIPFYIRLGMYRAVMRYLGNDALRCIFKSVTLGFLALLAVLVALLYVGVDVFRSRSILFMYWCLSLGSLGGLRLVAREYFTGDWFTAGNAMSFEFLERQAATPVAIYGAGAAGNELLASIRVGRLYRPVAFIDDNRALTGRTVAGLNVYNGDQVELMIEQTGAQEVFLALPSASRTRRQQILESLQHFPLHVRTIPGLADIASGRIRVEDLQEVDIADLLGREPVPPDPSLFSACIHGRAVLVTGAGGSIGSELCRQIVLSRPRTLVLFEHNEYGLYAIHSELEGWAVAKGIEIELVPFLGSVRNATRLQHAIEGWQVETIYHAAAYKHVPLVEYNMVEGIMNNVFGTLNVAQAAVHAGVSNLVLVSTDKAVRPTNVMGATKRLAELILQALSCERQPRLWGFEARTPVVNRTGFTMVRFGNVLGSSGSVIPLFREQIRDGGPVTVTHPEINRYFMTIPEAAQLVIQAGALGQGGDVFVLDMGEPVNIVDLARKMILLSGLSVRDESNPGGDIAIAFTGLRPGEKLYEELLIGDNPEPTVHSKIFRAHEDFLRWDELVRFLRMLARAVTEEDYEAMRRLLQQAVHGYEPADPIVDPLHVHQQHCKGVVADDRARAVDRVPKAQRLALTYHRHLEARRDRLAQNFEQFVLAAALELRFELVVHVEVIFDGTLAGVGD
jgi:UDP-N-acetylglucosamine 4,6-dehydratase